MALAEDGAWLGKGYGFAVPAEAAGLPQITMVHPLQLVAALPAVDGKVTVAASPGDLLLPR